MFSSYALRSPAIRRQIISRGQGAVRANIGQQELSKVQVFVPPFHEQEAIATLLSAMDAEIALLEAQLAKYRQLKQGLMQNLLTGRVRLVGRAGIAVQQSQGMT
jgi:type I restriction enzyme S subunit